MFFNTPLALLAAAAAVSAGPIVRSAAPIVMSVNQVSNVQSIKNIVTKGQDRIQAINSHSTNSNQRVDVSSGPATNDDVSYVASVNIGGYARSLIVDTGCE